MNCSTILFVSNTKSVVVFYLIFASLSRSSLKLGHDWEMTHFFLKMHYQFHLKCLGESTVQEWTRKIGEKKWDIISESKHMFMKPQIRLKAS